MAKFTNITAEQMSSFLTVQGFVQIQLPGVREMVFARRMPHSTMQLSLRVNTGIEAGESRDVGEDAIRVMLMGRADSNSRPVSVMGSKRVHRVEGWKANLQDRINKFESPKPCPKCGKPLVSRKSRTGEFLGCLGWKSDRSGCNHTETVQPKRQRANESAEREIFDIESGQM